MEDAACERCGSFDVLEIAGQFLCADSWRSPVAHAPGTVRRVTSDG
jgi:hypothetical protein